MNQHVLLAMQTVHVPLQITRTRTLKSQILQKNIHRDSKLLCFLKSRKDLLPCFTDIYYRFFWFWVH